jgi:S1-C subfamily serine protease
MNFKNILGAIIVFMLCGCSTFMSYNMTKNQVHEVVNASVEIEYGSGTVIYHDPETMDSVLITAYHVIDQALHSRANIVFRFTNDEGEQKEPVEVWGDVVAYSVAADTALVRFKSPVKLDPVPIADVDPDIGDTVYVFGNPMGSKSILTKGVLSNKSYINEHGVRMWQVDSKIMPGNSGGGVFNSSGELIGMPLLVSTYNVPLFQRGLQGNMPLFGYGAGRIFISHLGIIATRTSMCSLLLQLPTKYNRVKCK